jgi:GT2 family glycosyltransferase
LQRIINLIYKFVKYLAVNGFRKTLRKVFMTLKVYIKLKRLAKKWIPTEETLRKQRETNFSYAPLISIIVPTYNTPISYLYEMLTSVCAQSYSNWQLCIADGGDCANSIEDIIQQYSIWYPCKMKYTHLGGNRGISENTNAGIALADGEYIAFLDHDDILGPNALFEVVTVIEKQKADFIYTDEATFVNNIKHIINAHFKPDFAIDNLLAINYICHFTVVKKELLERTGLFRKEYDGSQDHDMILRLTKAAESIVHIPKVLYYWRAHENSVSAGIRTKSYAIEAGKKAVSDYLNLQGLKAEVESSEISPTIYRIKYEIVEKSLISILIINRDCFDKLQACIESIINKSTYSNYEIIVIDYGTINALVLSYYKEIEKYPNISVILWKQPFNYSAINNYGVKHAKGKYLILLHDDTEVIEPKWMEEMLMYAQRKDVGVVGAKLYYANDTVQHSGIILGIGKDRIVGYAHDKFHSYDMGYMGRLHYAQDISAVTAACMMVKKSIFEEQGRLDESFSAAFCDVDFCLRLRRAGYLVVFTPYAELYHKISKPHKQKNMLEQKEHIQKEIRQFKERWAIEFEAGDPYYNPNLTLDKADFSIKD